MTRIHSALTIAAAVLALGVPFRPAEAQLARTFVSSVTGNDANNCDRATPCRTFQTAHNKTLANGEITVLDPGGYGAMTITKTISIINDGVGEAGMLVSGGVAGITINAGATDKINLRGLTIKGIGFGGGAGIVFNSGQSLTVENCTIRNMTGFGTFPRGFGILFKPTGSSTFAATNTFVADNDGTGISIVPFSASAVDVAAVLNRVEAHNNRHGIYVEGVQAKGALTAVITESIADGNKAGVGFAFNSFSGGAAISGIVSRSVAANNYEGISSTNGNSTVRVGRSLVAGNVYGWFTDGTATLSSYADNNIDGNGNGNGPPPPIAKK